MSDGNRYFGLENMQARGQGAPWLFPISAILGAMFVFFLGWIGHAIIVPGADAITTQIAGDWRVDCPPRSDTKRVCVMTQNALNQKTGVTMLQFTLNAAEAPAINILVPLDVFLPAQLGFRVDDQKMKTLPYRSCESMGCIASIKGDSDFVSGLSNAKRLQVFFAGLDGKPLGFALSMKGFQEALSAMQSAEARRRSWLRRVLL